MAQLDTCEWIDIASKHMKLFAYCIDHTNNRCCECPPPVVL